MVWDIGDNKRYWYVGLFIGDSFSEGKVRVNHLQKSKESNHKEWIRPIFDDIQDVHPEQIIPCAVMGQWNFNKRVPTFVVENEIDINKHFNDFFHIE